jgi:hypothetical protein
MKTAGNGTQRWTSGDGVETKKLETRRNQQTDRNKKEWISTSSRN